MQIRRDDSMSEERPWRARVKRSRVEAVLLSRRKIDREIAISQPNKR